MLRWPMATALVTAALYIPYLYFYPFQMENERMFLSRIPEFLFGMYFAAYFYGAGRSVPDAPAGVPLAGASFLRMFTVMIND